MKSSSASALVALATLIFTTTHGAKAGSYSPLDPYADVQAPQAKVKAPKVKAEPRAKHVKDTSPPREASFSNQPEPEARAAESEPAQVKPAKVKQAKVKVAKVKEEKLTPAKAVKPSKPPKEVAEKPEKEESPLAEGAKGSDKSEQSGGFVSGLKEIQHGYMHTFKAAGAGIFKGTKAAGAKVADGTKKVSDGLSEGTKSSGNFFSRKKDALSKSLKHDSDKPKETAPETASNSPTDAPEKVAQEKPVKAPKEPKVAKAPKEPKPPKVAKAPKEPKVAKAPKEPKQEKIASLGEKPSKKLKMPSFGFGKSKEKDSFPLASRPVAEPIKPSEIMTPEEAMAHPEKFETLGKPLPELEPIKSSRKPIRVAKNLNGNKNAKGKSKSLMDKMNPFAKTAKAPSLPPVRSTAQATNTSSN